MDLWVERLEKYCWQIGHCFFFLGLAFVVAVDVVVVMVEVREFGVRSPFNVVIDGREYDTDRVEAAEDNGIPVWLVKVYCAESPEDEIVESDEDDGMDEPIKELGWLKGVFMLTVDKLGVAGPLELLLLLLLLLLPLLLLLLLVEELVAPGVIVMYLRESQYEEGGGGGSRL